MSLRIRWRSESVTGTFSCGGCHFVLYPCKSPSRTLPSIRIDKPLMVGFAAAKTWSSGHFHQRTASFNVPETFGPLTPTVSIVRTARYCVSPCDDVFSMRFIVLGFTEDDVLPHPIRRQPVFKLADVRKVHFLWIEEAFRIDLSG